MTRCAFRVTILAQEAEGGGHVLANPLTLGLGVIERGDSSEPQHSASVSSRNTLKYIIALLDSGLSAEGWQHRGAC